MVAPPTPGWPRCGPRRPAARGRGDRDRGRHRTPLPTTNRTWPPAWPAASTTRRTCRCSRCCAAAQLLRAARRASVSPCARGGGHRRSLAAGRRVAAVGGDPSARAARPAAGRGQRGRHVGRRPRRPAGAPVPIAPRRGFILVTQPLPPVVRHKVYAAEYVANVASRRQRPADLGRGRGRPGPAPSSSEPAGNGSASTGRSPCRCCAASPAQAVALFPVLARVQAIRALPRLPPVLAGPPAGDRARPARARPAARLRPRGRRHRPRPGHRRADRRVPHRRPAAASTRTPTARSASMNAADAPPQRRRQSTADALSSAEAT